MRFGSVKKDTLALFCSETVMRAARKKFFRFNCA